MTITWTNWTKSKSSAQHSSLSLSRTVPRCQAVPCLCCHFLLSSLSLVVSHELYHITNQLKKIIFWFHYNCYFSFLVPILVVDFTICPFILEQIFFFLLFPFFSAKENVKFYQLFIFSFFSFLYLILFPTDSYSICPLIWSNYRS